ncbi:MAG: 3-dehydroquinate synthase [Erysipelotrichaceae bacterium]|nr:3-dehydroquinate synthase [Erysipelotrichaceae bacterium]
MKLLVDLKERSYPIYIQRGILNNLSQFVDWQRKVMIITDSGVPKEYVERVLSYCKQGYVECFPQGEASKNMDTYQRCLKRMLQESFGRKDLVIAIGGGVVGDLAGFVAATYMRGIDFINIPTTTLSQIDSSIGGKTAIDMMGIKNCVGAFHQPKAVFIDPDTLHTLSKRHIYNGLVEALKAGLIANGKLVDLLDTEDPLRNIEEILYESLLVKKQVVEQDEKEQGLRKILNFGHTIGHGIESASHYELLHGEAVALGMIKIVEDAKIKELIQRIVQRWGIFTDYDLDADCVYQYLIKDKKAEGQMITIVQVHEIGKAKLQSVPLSFVKEKL